jgi:hypothetical protein
LNSKLELHGGRPDLQHVNAVRDAEGCAQLARFVIIKKSEPVRS